MKGILQTPVGNAHIVALLGVLVALLSASPAKALEPDIPSVKSAPEPASIQQQIELAADYFTGHGIKQDEKLAAYWYERAAAAGDPEAQKQIGYFYQIGLGVPQDSARAFHWYQLAAAGGLLSAKVNLGVAYIWGAGVARNVELGMKLFREAAEKGSGLGACYLGDVYISGMNGPTDKATAEQWYEKGVKLHEPRAEFDLAFLLSERENRSYNLPRAASLLRKSAEAGYVRSMHALGLLLANHPSLAKDPDEAVNMLDESAKAGNWRSSAALGILSRDGHFVPADSRNAYYHFRLATLQGGEAARTYLAKDLQILQEKLGPQDVATIEAQADSWHQQHPLALEFIYKGGEYWKKFPAYALATPQEGVYAGQLIPSGSF